MTLNYSGKLPDVKLQERVLQRVAAYCEESGRKTRKISGFPLFVIIGVSILCGITSCQHNSAHNQNYSAQSSGNLGLEKRTSIKNIPINRNLPPPIDNKKALEIFSNIIQSAGIYRGHIVDWKYSIPPCEHPGIEIVSRIFRTFIR